MIFKELVGSNPFEPLQKELVVLTHLQLRQVRRGDHGILRVGSHITQLGARKTVGIP